jgi:hypothetical protein
LLGAMLALGGFLHAADIDLGNFPLGKWLDANYDAVWEFSSKNIRILSLDGSVVYDFSEKTVNDFKVSMDGGSPAVSFSCEESGKAYKFVKPLTNMDIEMKIDRAGLPRYSVDLKKQ